MMRAVASPRSSSRAVLERDGTNLPDGRRCADALSRCDERCARHRQDRGSRAIPSPLPGRSRAGSAIPVSQRWFRSRRPHPASTSPCSATRHSWSRSTRSPPEPRRMRARSARQSWRCHRVPGRRASCWSVIPRVRRTSSKRLARYPELGQRERCSSRSPVQLAVPRAGERRRSIRRTSCAMVEGEVTAGVTAVPWCSLRRRGAGVAGGEQATAGDSPLLAGHAHLPGIASGRAGLTTRKLARHSPAQLRPGHLQLTDRAR